MQNISMFDMTRMFLFGSTQVPGSFESHVRDAGDGLTITLDVASHMGGAGRYASPFQSKVVSSFFEGSLDLSAYADSIGDVVVSLGQLIDDQVVSKQDSRWAVSQYTTDTASFDFSERAYIFGSEVYTIPESALFRIIDGEMSVIGAVSVPEDDNFDFESTHPFAQWVNENILIPLIDPYGIGRKVIINYDDQSKADWIAAHSSTILTASDDNSNIADFAETLNAASLALNAISSSAARVAIAAKYIYDGSQPLLATNGYKHDGSNVVYGTDGADMLDNAYGARYSLFSNPILDEWFAGLTGIGFDNSLPTIFVAGGGNDIVNIETYGMNTVHGGDGNDLIYTNDTDATVWAGAGNDHILGSGGLKYIHGEEGNDLIDVGGEGAVNGGAGNDQVTLAGYDYVVNLGSGADTIVAGNGFYGHARITDAGANDRITFDSAILDGGTRYLVSDDVEFEQTESYSREWTGRTVNADAFAIYGSDSPGPGFGDPDLPIRFGNGSSLTVINYGEGDLGLNVAGWGRITTTNPLALVPSGLAFFPSDLYGLYVGQPHEFTMTFV